MPDKGTVGVREPAKVVGKKILLFGDLHMSSSFEGQHISYIQECYENMETIKQICIRENPDAIVFAGDINGVSEVNVRDRQFFMRELQWFEYLNKITDHRVYSVKGNHDIGDFTDFDFLLGLGYIQNPRYIDFYVPLEDGDLSHEVRFHLVNYGYETAALAIAPEEECVSNIVLGHADYYIEGVTNWYSAKQGVEVARLDNFCGVELIISGHIHLPSTEILYSRLKDGKNIGLFFTGSPSRVAERYDDCWYVDFSYNYEDGATDCTPKLMGLKPASEIFYPEEDFELAESDEEAEMRERSEKLTALVKEMIEGRITSGDIVGQIKAIPGVDDATKQLAIDYYNKAEKGE